MRRFSLERPIWLGVGLFFKLAYGPAVWMFFSPEIMLQKPAELFEILGHSQLHARSQIPG